jgi:hypothetical protein
MSEFLLTPPPEMVKQWVAEVWHEGTPVQLSLSDMHIAGQAATWGYQTKLEQQRRWFRDNPLEDMSNSMLQNCRIVLNELQGARDLAIRTGHDPGEVSGPYLEMLLKLFRDHAAMEQLREASAECQPTSQEGYEG